MPVRDRVGGAGFHAIAAEDTSIVVNVINLGVTLRAGDALFGGVLGGFYINTVRRASCRAQEAGYTLLQTIFIALQDVHPAEAFLELRSLERSRAVGIVLHDGGLEHLLEGDAHTLSDGADVLDDGHSSLV